MVVLAGAGALFVAGITFVGLSTGSDPVESADPASAPSAVGPGLAREVSGDESVTATTALTDFNITIPPSADDDRRAAASSDASAGDQGEKSPTDEDAPFVNITVPPADGPSSTVPGPNPDPAPTPAGPTSVSVRAHGTTGTEDFELWVGQERVGRRTVSTSPADYTFSTRAEGKVEVRFVNDGATLVGNRDLAVDHTEIGGRRFQSEAPETYARNYWNEAAATCAGTEGNPQVDVLHCNGRFRYARLVGGQVQLLGGSGSPDEPDPELPPPPPPPPPNDSVPPDAKYVATNGSDGNPGTIGRPWRSIQHAANVAQPGDVIVVRAGTFNESVHVSRSGGAGGWIEFRNHPGERPVIRATDNPGFQVEPIVPGGFSSLSGAQKLAVAPVQYITVRGFDLAGENNTSSNGWASGVSVGYANHVRLLNNVIHGFPGGGVSTTQSDNVLVQGNQIRDVASTGLMQFSGLSAFQSVDRGGPDIEPGFAIVFRNNDVSGVRARLTTTGKEFNANYVNVANPADRADHAPSDGHYPDANCVIIDDGRNIQLGSPFPVFQGRTLVEQNTCHGNMGRGVHVYLSDHVVARNNTLRRNMGANRWYPEPAPFGHDPWADHRWTAELNATTSSDVRFENNLVEAAPGSYDRNSWNSTGVVFSGNRYVGPGIATSRTEGATFTGERNV